jgi:hypothetical protein
MAHGVSVDQMQAALADVVFSARVRSLVALAALMLAALVFRPALPASAEGVSALSIMPADPTAGNITSYIVSYWAGRPLAAGAVFTVDWTGNGTDEGVIQQLLPATAQFDAGASNCTAAASRSNGNTVVTVSDSGGTCTISLGPVQFTVTNVRNPKHSANRVGTLKTNGLGDLPVADLNFVTWPAGGLNTTAAGAPGIGPNVNSTAAINGSVDINAYVEGLNSVTLTTTWGLFAYSGRNTVTCVDGVDCDADHLLNGVVTLVLLGDGNPGSADVRWILPQAPNQPLAEATVTFLGPPAVITVAADPSTIPNDGKTVSKVTATLSDIRGNPVPDGTLVEFSTSSGALSSTSSATVNGVASVSLSGVVGGTAAIVRALAGGFTGSATVTISSFQATVPAGSAGPLCFTYLGPATTAASFGSFFNTAIDGVNLQASDGSYTSWFRALPSAATIGSIAAGARLCVSGPAGTMVFA